jgi:hypothetical protein
VSNAVEGSLYLLLPLPVLLVVIPEGDLLLPLQLFLLLPLPLLLPVLFFEPPKTLVILSEVAHGLS